MQANIPLITVDRTSMQSVHVGEVRVGTISIGDLEVNNLAVGVSTGAVTLRGVRLSVSVEVSLDWRVGVEIDLGFDTITLGWNGTVSLGVFSIPVPFPPDLDLTGFDSIDVAMPTLALHDLSAVGPTLHGLHLGEMIAEQLRVETMVAPQPPFDIEGIGLYRMRIDGVAMPQAGATTVRVGRVAGGSAPIPSLSLPGLTMGPISLGALSSGGLDASATANPYSAGFDAGVLAASVRFTPSARLQVDRLEVASAAASVATGAIQLRDVRLPFEVLDVTLAQLGVTSVQIPQIEVQ